MTFDNSVAELTQIEKHDLLQTIFETSPNSLSVFEPVFSNNGEIEDLRFVMVNAFTIQTTGRTDLIGMRYGEAFPHVKQTGILDAFIHVAVTGNPTEFERLYEGEGLRHWFHFKVSKAGRLVVAITEDITKRREAEEASYKSEEGYLTLFNSIDQGFCIIEMIIDEANLPIDYRFLEINPVFEQQTGLKDATGKTMRELVPQLESHWFETYGRVAHTGESIRFTEGSSVMGRLFDVFAFKIGDTTSRRVALLFTDITEKHRVQEAIKRSEQNLRNTILQAPVAMCMFKGADYVVEIANEKMFEFWGKQGHEILGKPIFEGLPEAKGQGFEELLASVYNTGNTVQLTEIPVTLPRNGKVENVFVNFVYEAFREADETVSGIMAVAIDVTEQVLARHKIEEVVAQRTKELAQVNENLLQTNAELKRSNGNLEDFAYAASHDLKEPIRKIHVFTGQLRSQLVPTINESQNNTLNRIEKATERMGLLVDDLLLFSYVSHKPQEKESVDLGERVNQVLEDLELQISQKNASIEVGALPIVQGYRRQLQQLFQNLISNALKYSKTDIPPVISIDTSSIIEGERQYHLIEVRDNGIGFAQEYEEKIFQMFQRLHGKAEYSGTGVGLSIVKKVMDNHDGFIRAESALGEGATFKVMLPVA